MFSLHFREVFQSHQRNLFRNSELPKTLFHWFSRICIVPVGTCRCEHEYICLLQVDGLPDISRFQSVFYCLLRKLSLISALSNPMPININTTVNGMVPTIIAD